MASDIRVTVTQKECDVIKGLPDRRVQQVAFAMLVTAKKKPGAEGWVSWQEANKSANIAGTRTKFGLLLHELYKRGMIRLHTQKLSSDMQVLYMDEESEPVMELSGADLEKPGLAFRAKFRDEPYCQCAGCGQWIKQAKNGRKKYCDTCATNERKMRDKLRKQKK